VSASVIERDLGVTQQTANALVRDFIQLGILKEITGQPRWRTYVFDRYLTLFIR
jgi:predicted DNA-binding transcriptional regulator